MSFFGFLGGPSTPTPTPNASKTIGVNGKAVVANVKNIVINGAPLVGKASVACADQLKSLGEQLRGIAKVIEENTPAAVSIAVAASEDLKTASNSSETVKKANELLNPNPMRGGRRASVISNAAIAGGTRRYLKAAVRTLKQLGGNATKAGEALPGAVVAAAEVLSKEVKRNVKNASVVRAQGALGKVVGAVNSTVTGLNSVAGTNVPALAVTPVPAGEVVASAKNAAAAILREAESAAKKGGYKRTMKGGYSLKSMLNRIMGGTKTKKAGKKGKKGGFFTFTPFNPNAPSFASVDEGFALAGKTSRAPPPTLSAAAAKAAAAAAAAAAKAAAAAAAAKAAAAPKAKPPPPPRR